MATKVHQFGELKVASVFYPDESVKQYVVGENNVESITIAFDENGGDDILQITFGDGRQIHFFKMPFELVFFPVEKKKSTTG